MEEYTLPFTAKEIERILREADQKELPVVTNTDNGKFLRVVNGAWATATVNNAEEAGF